MVNDNVNSPTHYKYGKKETIEVIRDCTTNDEYHGYLKGNILKYISRYKFKGEPLEDLQKANWYLNRLIKEVGNKFEGEPLEDLQKANWYLNKLIKEVGNGAS
jgi:hypothetical protein